MPHIAYSRADDGPADLCIATISAGNPEANYLAALVDTKTELQKRGIKADYLLLSGHVHVDDARNDVLRKFLEEGAAKIICIDDDVGWDADEFIKFVRRDRDVIAGIYPKKTDNPEYPVMRWPTIDRAEPDGLFQVRGVPAGFLMMTRSVVERLRDDSAPYVIDPGDPTSHLIFERGLVDGNRWSGDYWLSRKLTQLGIRIYIDPELHLTHAGVKTWSGCVGDHWRKEAGLPDPITLQAFEVLRAKGPITPDIWSLFAERSGNYPWCAPEGMMAKAYEEAAKPGGNILEVGSGLTTLIMSIAAEKSGRHVHTLEHDYGWFKKTREMIKRLKLRQSLLYYAPLREHAVGVWHEVPAELPDRFDLVVCDGPPRNLGDRKLLWHFLGGQIKSADWIVDDVDPNAAIGMGRTAQLTGRWGFFPRPSSGESNDLPE